MNEEAKGIKNGRKLVENESVNSQQIEEDGDDEEESDFKK